MCRITKTTHLCGHCTREIDLCCYGRRLGPSWCPYGNCVRRAVPRSCKHCQTLQVQQYASYEPYEISKADDVTVPDWLFGSAMSITTSRQSRFVA